MNTNERDKGLIGKKSLSRQFAEEITKIGTALFEDPEEYRPPMPIETHYEDRKNIRKYFEKAFRVVRNG